MYLQQRAHELETVQNAALKFTQDFAKASTHTRLLDTEARVLAKMIQSVGVDPDPVMACAFLITLVRAKDGVTVAKRIAELMLQKKFSMRKDDAEAAGYIKALRDVVKAINLEDEVKRVASTFDKEAW